MSLFRFDFDFLKNRYDYELQRKEQLTAALTLPVGVLTVLGGAVVAMARTFSYSSVPLAWGFDSLLLMVCVAFLTCLVQLVRAYHRQTYVYLPLLRELDSSREEFLEFARHVDGGETDVIQAFEGQLRRRLIDAADRNTQTNDERSGFLHRARLALFGVLVLTAFAGIPYVIDQMRY